MAFRRREGRETREEAPVAPVAWAGVREFTIGSMERPATKRRPRPVRGPRAIRVPAGSGDGQVFAPCAYVARSTPPVPPTAMDRCLYEDAESQRLLCYLVARELPDGESRYEVYDAEHRPIGTLRRIPPSGRLFKHTWRMHQPGHPDVVGRNQWHPARLAHRAAENFVPEVLNIVTGLGPDDSHGPQRKARTLEWVADGDAVMVSESVKLLRVEQDWLDRRLAFAYAFLGDG
ncbi:hypothetical protein OG432_13545 [Streptomyces sp. NBC_00442]|uniref:hypothetical protein n=1 Tax=Streptomyces sp. NBC_00442 TaxID=2903651 RepID=UPI002E204452